MRLIRGNNADYRRLLGNGVVVHTTPHRVVVRWSGLPSNTHARSHRYDSVELLLVGREYKPLLVGRSEPHEDTPPTEAKA